MWMIPWKLEWKLWRKPGAATSFVAQPPPTTSRASSTSTRCPAFARYDPHVSPLWPPPTMTTSKAPSAIGPLVIPELLRLLPALRGLEIVRRDVPCALEAMGRRGERASLDQAVDVATVDLVHLGVRHRVTLHPEVLGVDRLLVHPAEDLRPQVLQPVRVEVHHAELTERLDVDDPGDESVVAGRAVGQHVPQVIDDVRVPAPDVVGMLHPGMQVYGPHVRTDHVDAVEVGVGASPEDPGAPAG